MGILLRGTQETFNPQIHTEANSLTHLMQKSMAVRKKSLDLFARYTKIQSFMNYTGRTNKGVSAGKVHSLKGEGLNDNAYRVSYEGALILPAYSMGSAVIGSWYDPGNQAPNMSGITGVDYTNGIIESTVTTNVPGSIAVKHDPQNEIYGDKFNPNDTIVLSQGTGLIFIIQQHPRRSNDGSHYVLDGKFIGPAGLFNKQDLDEDVVLTEGGNFFGEGSLRGWQRYTRNKWRINYSSIHRSTVTMTGSAKRQKICWIINSETGSRVWEYDEVLKNDQIFHLHNELSLRFSRISMNASGHAWFENYGTNNLTLSGFKPESGLAAPIFGEGWIPMISDNFTVSYDPNSPFNYKLIEAMMMVLAQRSPAGNSGNVFLAVGDSIGEMAIDAGFKKLIGYGNNASSTEAGTITSAVENITSRKDTTLGFQVTKYFYLQNTFYYINDEIFSNPAFFNTNGGVTGSGNIYVLNITPLPDGVSNFEILHGAKRGFIRKNEPGMHSFDDSLDAGNWAASGFDGCSIHSLAELMPILYDVRSCGMFKANAAYNGGALAGNPMVDAPRGATQFMW